MKLNKAQKLRKKSFGCRENPTNGLKLLLREVIIIINKLKSIIKLILSVFPKYQFSPRANCIFAHRSERSHVGLVLKALAKNGEKRACVTELIVRITSIATYIRGTRKKSYSDTSVLVLDLYLL